MKVGSHLHGLIRVVCHQDGLLSVFLSSRWSLIKVSQLVSWLALCVQSTTKDYIRAEHKLHSISNCPSYSFQWGAEDAEIKVPSGEITELKRSPFKAWSMSAYSLTCYAYCQKFLPCLLLPFQSIHLHFFQNLSRFFPALAVAITSSCVCPQNKIGHPAECRFPC